MMDILSCELPVLGMQCIMNTDFIRFRINEKPHRNFVFRRNKRGIPICVLYNKRSPHQMIIDHLQKMEFPPLLLEKKNKHKYYLSFDWNECNIQFLCGMFQHLFSPQKIQLEVGVFSVQNVFGRKEFHLLDLYEMGYMSMTPVHHNDPFLNDFPCQMFAGLFVRADNPFLKCPYDFVELDFSHNPCNKFLTVSLDMLAHHRPQLMPTLNAIINRIVESLPIRDPRYIMLEWNNTYEFEIRSHDFLLPVCEWKPCLFLKHLSRLLDYFPSYYIDQRFHVEATMFKKVD